MKLAAIAEGKNTLSKDKAEKKNKEFAKLLDKEGVKYTWSDLNTHLGMDEPPGVNHNLIVVGDKHVSSHRDGWTAGRDGKDMKSLHIVSKDKVLDFILEDHIFEMALNARQEDRFLKKLDKEIETKGYPNARKMKELLKSVEPDARQLGAGSASSAFGKEGSKSVVKVSREKDPCAFLFLNWAFARPKSKHLPKIYGLAEPVKGHIYVRMEPLKPFKFEDYPWEKKHLPFLIYLDETHTESDLDFFPAVPHAAYLKAMGFKRKSDMPDEWMGRKGRSSKYGYKKLFSKKKALELHRLSKKKRNSDPLIKAAQGIKGLVRKHRKICWNDTAPNRNWLMRPGTNDIVFADPVATFFSHVKRLK